MAGTVCEKLAELKKQLYLTKLSDEHIRTAAFHVIAIHRYLSDPRHCVQTGLTSSQSSQNSIIDVLQLTITDQSHKLKCVLSPELNKLVQSTELQVGHEVRLTKAKLHHDETSVSSSQVVIIIEELEIVGHRSRPDTDVSQLRWLDGSSVVEQLDVPVTSSRGYYINVWSSMEMYGSIWKTTVPQKPCFGNVTAQDIYTIRDMTERRNTLKASNPALLVRVLMKSRLLHYAKHHKNDKWPFQAQLLVGDDTGTCKLVLWNAMCPNLFYSLTEGTILLLQKFTVKKSFQLSPRFRPAMKGRQHFDIDINLNSHHPEAEVTIVDPATVPDQVTLPSVTYNFATRQQASGLVDNYKCDVVGVVTYVGRYEREPIANKFGKDSGGYWVRRWIHLMDSSSKKPFVIQLYRATEGMRQQDIQPGDLLVCSHLRVIHRLEGLHNSRTKRFMYLTTTAETQTQILDADLQAKLRGEKAVEDVLQWSVLRECQDQVLSSTVGGYYNIHVLYRTVEELKTCSRDEQIVSSEEWERLLSSLSYRESRQIIVSACMVHVKCYIPLDTSDKQSSPKKSPKRVKMSQPECSVDDTMGDIYENSGGMTCLGAIQLDTDTSFPMKYSPEMWALLSQRLLFPLCNLDGNAKQNVYEDTSNTVQLPHFTVTWVGLNTKVLLQTNLFCPPSISPRSQLIDIVCGETASQLAASSTVSSPLSVTVAERVVATARQCADKQFVLLLDCFQGEQGMPEIFINRAWTSNT